MAGLSENLPQTDSLCPSNDDTGTIKNKVHVLHCSTELIAV